MNLHDEEMSDSITPPNDGTLSVKKGFPTLSNGLLEPSSSDHQSNFTSRESRDKILLSTVANHLRLGSPLSSSDSDSHDELAEGGASMPTLHHLHALPYTTLRTGLCYDARMRFHTELEPPRDRANYHPEDPRRIFFIYRELCEAGLVADDKLTMVPVVANPVKRIPARLATRDEVCRVHTVAHLDFIKSTAMMSEAELTRREKTYDSIYFHQLTYTSALLSAGGAIETCLAVAAGRVRNAIAIIRPPGHHAECDRSMGFCHFDNVSIATSAVREKYPDEYRKVMILDWDVHHGNGIQQAFESDPNVLYISIHVHENGTFYPPGPYGDMHHCGMGEGVGKNINIPWPTKGMGDADYLFAFQHIVMPVAFDFDPDLVIVAAGFDAAAGDQLGGCFVSPACYAHMTHMLMSLADGKIVVCLEGGYNLRSISKSALAVTKTLMGQPPDRMRETSATRIGISTVKKIIVEQSKYWRCLVPKDISADLSLLPLRERMHDVIREYQTKCLADEHDMIPLWIYREGISKSFENQVLATANYFQNVPLLVIFHDPPEMIGTPDPITSKLDLHTTWLADELKGYIAWAVENGFGIVDVNIPTFLTGISDEYGDEEEEKAKTAASLEELAIYVWENYIECNESTRVFFIGVGEAYRGILHILNTRNYEAQDQIAGIVGFAAGNALRPVTENFITDFAKWYYRNSLIFVDREHPVWAREKKASRKFGQLKQSPVAGLNALLDCHKTEVQNWLLARSGLQSIVTPLAASVTISLPLVEDTGTSKEKGTGEDEDTIMVAVADLVAPL